MAKSAQTLVALAALGILPAGRCFADSLTVDTVEPSGSNIIIENQHTMFTSGSPGPDGRRDTFTTIFPTESGSGVGDRGQTFMTPTNPNGTTWDLNAITVRADADASGVGVKQDYSTGPSQSLSLWVFKWNPSDNANTNTNWIAGDGMSDGNPFNGTGIGPDDILVNGANNSFDATRSWNGQYLHFNLGTSHVVMSNDTAYGFILAFENNTTGFKLDSVRDGVAPTGESYALGGILRVDASSQTLSSSGDDLVFYVDATPSPEPTTAGLFGVGAMLMLSKRTRRRT